MAGALKLKISISGVAIFVLTLLPLIENKFFAPVTIKRWSRLTIDDFQGIPQPLSSFAAAISSSIYLEYDTAVGKYFAYAGQSNIRSWAKRREDGRYNYLLDHEQCHFNITEYYARKLNK
ncbi:MAG TPA: hypothetical protein VFE50_22745, partial [Cyclobacteriaceae bacterium]|nr:hypothetical protein [Cyclobacteriaceae bacterium]